MTHYRKKTGCCHRPLTKPKTRQVALDNIYQVLSHFVPAIRKATQGKPVDTTQPLQSPTPLFGVSSCTDGAVKSTQPGHLPPHKNRPPAHRAPPLSCAPAENRAHEPRSHMNLYEHLPTLHPARRARRALLVSGLH